MFTDLAGFTPLMEANAAQGRSGAKVLLDVLNDYFSEMLEIISKAGGDLLEFTGDAVLAQFPTDPDHSEITRAIRAGLRIQRAMRKFSHIETPQGIYSLKMRIGIHVGRFLAADIGTPQRMEHVLLGETVLRAKQAEGAGQVGRVCLSEAACHIVLTQQKATPQDTPRTDVRPFCFEPGKPGHHLVIDDLTPDELGEYELIVPKRRASRAVLWDLSIASLIDEIEQQVSLVDPLASYLPMSILQLLVESTARRKIPPDFITPTVVFVNFIGLAEVIKPLLASSQDEPQAADAALASEIVACFSRAISLINGAVEVRGGIMRKVTYHLTGSDIMICFGVPTAHTNDPQRAVDAALAIRDIINQLATPSVGEEPVAVACRIGISQGPAFAAEVGETRGRREFNILSNTVNTAARLMTHAEKNQILMTEAVYEAVKTDVPCEALGPVALKGKANPIPLFTLTHET
jgi:class 3 adenylate cyclase